MENFTRTSRYGDITIDEFAARLASSQPVPGGGGASALAGALAAALGNMVGSLTLGKRRYQDVEPDIRRLMAAMSEVQNDLISQIDRDAEAFEPLARAYRLPRETDEEKKVRDTAIQKALLRAAAEPLGLIKTLAMAVSLIEGFAMKGSKAALSDAATAAALARGAMYGAAVNVYVNTGAMDDRGTAEKMNEAAENLLVEYSNKADAIYERIVSDIRGSEG